jgi:putrescine transport system substrate-binding protein
VANDPTVFLGPEDMKRMEPPGDLSNDSRRAITRMYSAFKTGL